MISFCSSTRHWLCKSVWNPSSSSPRSAVSPASSDGEVDLSMGKLHLSGKMGGEWDWVSVAEWKPSPLALNLEHLDQNLNLQLQV